MTKRQCNQNFNKDFNRLCAEVHAPAFQGNQFLPESDLRTTDIKEAILQQINDYPVHVALSFILTDMDYIEALMDKDVSIIVNKSEHLTEENIAKMATLGCTIPKTRFPDMHLAHIVARDKSLDFGLLDGVRTLGNEKQVIRGAIPLGHARGLCSGKLVGKKVSFECFSRGTFNFSNNASNSFEMWETDYDPERAKGFFGYWRDLYSVSERLCNVRPGLTPEFTYVKKVPTYKKYVCPDCGVPLRTYSAHADDRLRCPQCGEKYIP